MALKNSQFDFCKKIGLMKENISRQDALNLIKASFANNGDCDPEFKEIAAQLTLDNFTYAVAPIYHYDVDLKYVLNRKTYTAHIADLGYYHVYKQLEITNYYGDGNYTVVNNLDALNLIPYHQDCIFTLQEMKKALTDTIDKKLPNGYSSFESERWDVNALLVPVIYAWINFKGQKYNVVANLHNKKIYTASYARWEAPYKAAKKARALSLLTVGLSLILPVLGIILSAVNQKWIGLLPAIIGGAVAVFGLINIKGKSTTDMAKPFKKQPMPNVAVGMIRGFVFAGIVLICFIFVLIALAAA